MTISSVSNSYAAQQVYNIQNSNSAMGTAQGTSTTSTSANSTAGSGTSSSTIDFTNMTQSDFSSLVGAGKLTGGFSLLMSLPQGIGTNVSANASQNAYTDTNK